MLILTILNWKVRIGVIIMTRLPELIFHSMTIVRV